MRAEERRSPEAVRRRRARLWFVAVLLGIGIAVAIGALLPVDQGPNRDKELPARQRRQG